jgi:tetratricopeptide (TPR) repeat protein/CHAT domain-containing protein
VLGPDHPDTAQNLNNLAGLYENQSAFAKAEPLYLRALAITEKVLGPDHPDTTQNLNNLAGLYENQSAFAKAEPLYVRVLAIREKVLGPDHPDTAQSLNNLAGLYENQSAFAKAEPLYLRALAITEKVLGPDHPDTAQSLINLAVMYRNQSAYSKAEPLFQRSLQIREKVLGHDHPDTATSLKNLGLLYADQGAYGKAESLFQRSLAILEKALGPDHRSTATDLNNLATLYYRQGVYTKAEPLFQRSLAILEKVLGHDHPDTATSLNNLALFYENQGNYDKAEVLFQRSLAISEKVQGHDHRSTATKLNNLSTLYYNQGAYTKAEPLYHRSLAILEKVLGPDHPDTATILNNLAFLYYSQGAYAKAEPHYLRAFSINEKALGPNHSSTATSLNNLAGLYYSQGAYTKAEPLYLRALTINEKALGPDHPDTATSLNNLAFLYDSQGAYTKAEPLYQRSLAIFEKVLGPYHRSTSSSLNNLARVYTNQGAYTKAETLLVRAIRGELVFLQREVPLLPEIQRQAQIQAVGNAWEAAFGYASRSANGASLALFTRLNRQGLLQEIEQRQALLAQAPGRPQELRQQIAGLTSRLADLNLSTPQRLALQQQHGDLEQQLYRLLPALKLPLVEPSEVAHALPADGVLVEFQRYRPFDGRQPPDKRWGKPRYLALLLFPDGRIERHELGLATAIDPLIQNALEISEAGERSPHELWIQVRDKVFPPALLSQLKDRRQWFVSPDGELNRIPFAALPTPPQLGKGQGQRWLAEAVRLRLLTSGRDLLQRPSTAASQSDRALVIANPDFGAPGTPWAPLPATAKEGRQIAAQLKAALLEGTQATAPALQQVRGPRVLHVASHGFFSGPQSPNRSPSPSGLLGTRSAAFAGPPAHKGDPLLNSGIVLAGANRHAQPAQSASAQAPAATADGDDGYLTAKEVARMQLEGTELVVLSACETASGTIQSGEGVYGLQRALKVAGASSTLLSLWKVDDDATAFFMERYYTLLKQGKGRQEALVQVQEEFRSNPQRKEWKDYKYWAAWQLSGAGSPMPGL